MQRIGAFAHLAGVTVKALYHYERHGLLKPRRTTAGYRRYSRRDLIQLQRILALKSLGLSLGQIQLVQSDRAKAAAVFADQRRALGEKLERITRAVGALDAIQQAADPANALDRFVAESGWDRAEARRRAVASPVSRAPDRVAASKLELFRDIEAVLDRDQDEGTAQSLVARWDALVHEETGGDADTIARIRKGWENWRHYPDGMRRYVASLYGSEPAVLERVVEFIQRTRDIGSVRLQPDATSLAP
jgi:DNA-binding transcriptional MerR regulator